MCALFLSIMLAQVFFESQVGLSVEHFRELQHNFLFKNILKGMRITQSGWKENNMISCVPHPFMFKSLSNKLLLN